MKPASLIHLLERDYFLKFNEQIPVWPPANLKVLKQPSPPKPRKRQEVEWRRTGTWLAGKWQREEWGNLTGGCLYRELRKASWDPKTHLVETMVRFPSAPLFGCQRKLDYQVRLKPVHQHTFRLLTTSRPDQGSPIERIFLFFNGLNEIDHFGFYYDLAGMLIAPDGIVHPEVACLVYPFPGHLTRYPMIGHYAEKPLQRFITDPSDLFRQYLRFMVEMQWLLSTLVPVSYYPVAPGIALLAEDSDPRLGRCDLGVLSQHIFRDWQKIFDNSSRLLEQIGSPLKHLRKEPELLIGIEDIQQSVAAIRKLIGWKRCERKLAEFKSNEPLPPPRIHVIGYSLGGYLAQSVFFTWPFAIGSCTTLCSGGALHDLRPVKIVHEEEWRAITHGLKYELECGMLEGRISADKPRDPHLVCGVPTSYFSSHFRIFNDVFLQDPQGSYRSRVSEFAPRLLFVVGGNDPIVSTQSVLDASPPEGINMIEISKLSHFLAIERGEWPNFWLPTMAKVIYLVSERGETLMATSVLSNLWNLRTTGRVRGTWQKEGFGGSQRRVQADPLDSSLMQETLLELVNPLERGGFLFILRNQIPFTLMGRHMLHRRGSVPHYEDFQIRRFWKKLQERRLTMRHWSKRITLVIPGRLNEWFVRRPSILSVKSFPLARELRQSNGLKNIWNDFLTEWEKTGALYRFDPEDPETISEDRYLLEYMIRKDTSTPDEHWILNCLPDIWVSLSQEVVKDIAGEDVDRDGIHEGFLEHVHILYQQKYRHGTHRKQALGKTRNWLASGDLAIVRVSAAQSNPSFLGERIWDQQSVIDLLIHSALALARSTPCRAKGDFAKNWGERKPIP